MNRTKDIGKEVIIESNSAIVQNREFHSAIGKLRHMPNRPFILYVETKKLVKRKAFEEFISKKTVDITIVPIEK